MHNWFSALSIRDYFLGLCIVISIWIITTLILKIRGKRIRPPEQIKTPIGIFQIEDIDRIAHHVSVLNHPTDTDNKPAVLSPIKVVVYNKDNHPINNKEVIVMLMDVSSSKCQDGLQGTLRRNTDRDGLVVFSDLSVNKRGSFYLKFDAGEIAGVSKEFQVTPPGIDTNFVDKSYGTDEYYEALKTSMELNKGSDRVFIKGEEI